ncbi:MAG TPA: hypothetical protein VIY48_19985 [Candidatus Paceibacterota bacterium]
MPQLLVPPLGYIYVPILKNASTTLSRAITTAWPDAQCVGPEYPGKRVVMWRNPVDRIESTYRFMRDQGMDTPFAKWVCQIIAEGLHDPHVKPQVSFCDNAEAIIRWDFMAFRKLFKLRTRDLIRRNESGTYPTEWDDRAKEAFVAAYVRDIRIWGGYNAQAFGKEAARSLWEEDKEDERRGQVCLGSSKIDGPGY